MTDHTPTVSPVAVAPRPKRVYFQPRLFDIATVEKQRKRWQGLPPEEKCFILSADFLDLRNQKISLEKQVALLTEKYTTEKQKAKDQTKRRSRLLSVKLKLEQAIEHRDKVNLKCQAARREIADELKDRDKFVKRLEATIDRQQKFIDNSTIRLNLVGRVPSVRCNDCKFPKPLTSFKIRVPSSPKKDVENWCINAICTECWAIRSKRVDEKRKALGSSATLAADKADPAVVDQEVSKMAMGMVERLPGIVVDRFAEEIQREGEDE